MIVECLNDPARSRDQPNRANCDPRHGGVSLHSADLWSPGTEGRRRTTQTRWRPIMSKIQEIRPLADAEVDLIAGAGAVDSCIKLQSINVVTPPAGGEYHDVFARYHLGRI